MLHSRLRLLVEALNRAADQPSSRKASQVSVHARRTRARHRESCVLT